MDMQVGRMIRRRQGFGCFATRRSFGFGAVVFTLFTLPGHSLIPKLIHSKKLPLLPIILGRVAQKL